MRIEQVYTGVSQATYSDAVYECGTKFIEAQIKNVKWQGDVLKSSSFWSWWIASWEQREKAMVNHHAKQGTEASISEWRKLHSMDVAIPPNMCRGLGSVVHDVIKGHRKELKHA